MIQVIIVWCCLDRRVRSCVWVHWSRL